MAYEYESKLYANSVIQSITENVFIETGETKEIKEVYRKAKGWQELKAGMLESYANYERQKRINKNIGFYKILEGAQTSLAPVLEYMDKLDGTNDFSNLLNDLEDKQND